MTMSKRAPVFRTFRIMALCLLAMLVAGQVFAQDPGNPTDGESFTVTSTVGFRVALEDRIVGSTLYAPGDPAGIGVLPEQSNVSLLDKRPDSAFLRSLILPGWGQRYGERYVRGAIYTSLDVIFWSGLIYSQLNYNDGVGHYEAFARIHAGVTGDQTDQFWVDIGNYDNRDDFNEAQRQQRDYDSQYRRPGQFWDWDTESNRTRFEDLRIEAGQHRNRVWYFLGGLVINRVISAIDASRGLTIKQKEIRESQVTVGYNVRVNGPGVVWTGDLF